MSEFKQTVIAETAIDGQRPVLRMVDGLADPNSALFQGTRKLMKLDR